MKNMMQKIRNRKGFTLVELMIVVAIIGILAAIAIPAFLRSVKKSKTSEAEGTMRKLADGSKGYFQGEQKFSQSAPNGGDQPWHVGNTAQGNIDTVGMPVEWASYVFPGTVGYQFNTALAAQDGGNSLAACTDAPTGGAKQLGFTGSAGQPTTAMDLNSVLNRIGVSFPDQYYFTYNYDSANAGPDSELTISALAEFKTGGDCHTIQQVLSVDDITQEVLVGPSNTSFEYE